MTDEESNLISIMKQAQANIECENLTVSEDCYLETFLMHIHKEEQKTNRDADHRLKITKRKEFKNGR